MRISRDDTSDEVFILSNLAPTGQEGDREAAAGGGCGAQGVRLCLLFFFRRERLESSTDGKGLTQ